MWYDTPVILAFWEWGQEDCHEFWASLGYSVRSFLKTPPWPTRTGAFDSLPVGELRCFRKRLHHVLEELWIETGAVDQAHNVPRPPRHHLCRCGAVLSGGRVPEKESVMWPTRNSWAELKTPLAQKSP